MAPFSVRPANSADQKTVTRLLTDRWLSPEIVSRGRLHQADRLPAFVAQAGEEMVGLATYRLDGDRCEIVSLDSLREGIGVGAALLDAVTSAAHSAGCRRLWLVTTNDNTVAMRFYKRRGWRLAAVHHDAVVRSRELKPSIPNNGQNGAPIRDEIEFELFL